MDDSGNFKFRPVEPDKTRVPCPRCGEMIERASTRCEMCGIHFKGCADDFAPLRLRSRPVIRTVAVALLIVIATLLILLTIAGITGAAH